MDHENPWAPSDTGSLQSILAAAANLDLIDPHAGLQRQVEGDDGLLVEKWIKLKRDLNQLTCSLELCRLVRQYQDVFDEKHPELIRCLHQYYDRILACKQRVRNVISAPICEQALIVPKRYHKEIVKVFTEIQACLPELRAYENDLRWASTQFHIGVDGINEVCSKLNQRLGQLERYSEVLNLVRSQLEQYSILICK